MKRNVTLVCLALIAVGAFIALTYAVLAAAHVAEPAATTVHGLTARRLWATTVVLLALAGVVAGSVALFRAGRSDRAGSRPAGAILALVAGPIAAVNGALVVGLANGGPGTGNGVVGGAAALVLGLVAVVLGWRALARWRGDRVAKPA